MAVSGMWLWVEKAILMKTQMDKRNLVPERRRGNPPQRVVTNLAASSSCASVWEKTRQVNDKME